MARFERAFGEWVVNHRWWMIIIALLIVSLAGSGIRYLSINNDTRVFFSEKRVLPLPDKRISVMKDLSIPRPIC